MFSWHSMICVGIAALLPLQMEDTCPKSEEESSLLRSAHRYAVGWTHFEGGHLKTKLTQSRGSHVFIDDQ
jgi:hypothetical protein